MLQTLKIEESQYSEDLAAGDVVQWDSLGHLSLLMAVEKAFGVTFDIGDAIEIESVGDLIDTVRRYT
ncbi:acyl carrier protein [Rhizorhapis sp. SPR117]|uniref:acyl carrier protein n=1 Tax=Rhizorhapis sp. SPR117 TaxID=2912611 RepID=UPI001F3387BC|nr:acyl carrier protein [Rhizorhapis sp. SPR117]